MEQFNVIILISLMGDSEVFLAKYKRIIFKNKRDVGESIIMAGLKICEQECAEQAKNK